MHRFLAHRILDVTLCIVMGMAKTLSQNVNRNINSIKHILYKRQFYTNGIYFLRRVVQRYWISLNYRGEIQNH